MADTIDQECNICGEEADCIDNICANCEMNNYCKCGKEMSVHNARHIGVCQECM